MKKPWKIVACMPAVDEAPGYHEYFIVRATDPDTALTILTKARPDLLDVLCEVMGEAGRDCLDWPELGHRDVFSIMALPEPPARSGATEAHRSSPREPDSQSG